VRGITLAQTPASLKRRLHEPEAIRGEGCQYQSTGCREEILPKFGQGLSEEHEGQKSEYPAQGDTKNFQRELLHRGIGISSTVANKN
jgi:hypothetical protein